MGSKEEDLPVEPVEKTVFLEDMSENELATAVSHQFIFYNYVQVSLSVRNRHIHIKHILLLKRERG